MLDIGRPDSSHTVAVSAASGAVGSVAAQVAKRSGARVVGIAGGPAKCAYLVDGIERFPEALRMLFTGKNHGKLLLRP